VIFLRDEEYCCDEIVIFLRDEEYCCDEIVRLLCYTRSCYDRGLGSGVDPIEGSQSVRLHLH